MCREAEYLAKYGVESDFLVARPWAPWPLHCLSRWQSYGPANTLAGPEDLEARQVRYVRPPGMWFRRFEGMSMAMSLGAAARNWHRERPFDVVLGVPMIPDAAVALRISKDLSLPLAALAIGSDVMVYPKQMPALQHRLSKILGNVDLPVGVSESICNKLVETKNLRREPLCVYLGRDSEMFSPAGSRSEARRNLGWAEDETVAVYTGSISETKGIIELAEAAEELLRKYPKFKLVCVGEGPAIEHLVRLKAKTGTDRAVVLTGQIPPEEVPKFLKGSDFMVFPSHSEGMPQALLEAMDCGLAAVASRVGGIPEAVIDGKTGVLIEPKNVEQLVAAMEKMICDREFRTRAGHEARAFAAEKFDPEKNAKKFADALWSLVG